MKEANRIQLRGVAPSPLGVGSGEPQKTPSTPFKTGSRAGLDCSDCPLNGVSLLHPKMLPTGADHPIFYFLGEAAGRTEDIEGEQFVGESGQIIRARIPSKYTNTIRWNNTIRCRPTKEEANREPSPQEIACCRSLQIADIEYTKPKVVVGFGAIPLNWALSQNKDGGEKKITVWRGRRVPVRIGKHICWFYPITHPAALLYARTSKRNIYDAQLCTFERDLKYVFSDYDRGLPKPEIEPEENYYTGIKIIDDYTRQGFNDVLRWLTYASKLDHSTIDIETSELQPYNKTSKILSCAIGTYEETLAFPLEHSKAGWNKSQLRQIYAALEAYLLSPGHKYAHYAKFEQEWLVWKFGPKIAHEVAWEDTATAAHVLDERSGKSLENLTEIHFGFNVKKLSNLDTKKLDDYPVADVLKYNALDTKYTDALQQVLFSVLEEQNLMKVYQEFNQNIPSFVMMQARGVVRNQPVIEQFSQELSKRKSDITASIQEDTDVKEFIKKHGKFKPTSNPDLQKFFRDYLKTPHPNQGKRNFKYSLTEDILVQLEHPVAAQILDLRTTAGNLSKYVEPLLVQPSDLFPDGGRYVCDDGLAHASFSQIITATGRSACENPPLQQWPKREHREIRRVICAPAGCVVGSFDYGQLEARIIAMLSQDVVLSAEICNKYDIHGDWTDRLGAAFDPKALKTKVSRKHLREYIKNKWTFPLLYGSALESVAYDLSGVFGKELSLSVLEEFYHEFWDKYAGVHDWQNHLEHFYKKHHYVETAFGFRRHAPLTKNELINAPVQGTAAQLVVHAQRRLSTLAYQQNKPHYQTVINQHDDLISYLPNESLEESIEVIAREMCSFPGLDFVTVPLSVEVSIGDNWADLQEIGTFYTTDFSN